MRRNKGFLTGMIGAKQKLLDSVAFVTKWCIFTKVLFLKKFVFIIALVPITTFFYNISTSNNTYGCNHTRISVIAFCSYLFVTYLHHGDRVRWTWIVPTIVLVSGIWIIAFYLFLFITFMSIECAAHESKWLISFRHTTYCILFLSIYNFYSDIVQWIWIMSRTILFSYIHMVLRFVRKILYYL